MDIDVRLDPEPEGAFEAIAGLKDELDVNVELAAPDQFIPEVPGWRDRSSFVSTSRSVDFFHYDLVAQALSKTERDYARDVDDVNQMVKRGLVSTDVLLESFERIRPALVRYPSIDADAFEQKVRAFVARERSR